MKALFVGLFFVVGSTAMAQDLNFNAYRKFLMQGNGTQKVAIQTTCTNAEGTVYRIGENGYDTCLSSLKKATKAPGAPAAGAGATIHFGN